MGNRGIMIHTSDIERRKVLLDILYVHKHYSGSGSKVDLLGKYVAQHAQNLTLLA